jgi:hypothetical protein
MIADSLGKPRQAYAKVQALGEALANGPWKKFVETIDDDRMKFATAICLDNAYEHFQSLDETTRALSVGDFQKFAFPLIRAIFPELAAQSLVSVQPMSGPTSLVFYMDYVYGSTKGSVTQGTTVFDSLALGPNNPYYSSSLIDAESIGTGAGGTTKRFQYSLQYTTVRAGTITIKTGDTIPQIVTDDGNGNLVGDVDGTGNNTINYQNGAIDVTFTTAPANGVTIIAQYNYDLEAQTNLPEIDLVFSSQPVIAQPRKLKIKWSLESSFNAQSLHGIDVETEVTAAVGAEIRFEIDREIIADIRNIVPTSNLAPAWSGSKLFNPNDSYGTATGAATTVGYTEQLLSIVNQMVNGSNKIFKATGRAIGTWLVIGLNVANILETLPGFVGNPGIPNGLVKGVYNAGVLNNRWVVFKDPFYPDNEWLMGYKGTSFLEAGYIYAPYIPLYSTPLIVLDDFIARKGLATQYAKKVINYRFYSKGQIVA